MRRTGKLLGWYEWQVDLSGWKPISLPGSVSIRFAEGLYGNCMCLSADANKYAAVHLTQAIALPSTYGFEVLFRPAVQTFTFLVSSVLTLEGKRYISELGVESDLSGSKANLYTPDGVEDVLTLSADYVLLHQWISLKFTVNTRKGTYRRLWYNEKNLDVSKYSLVQAPSPPVSNYTRLSFYGDSVNDKSFVQYFGLTIDE
jgi:hypothetical protein